MATFFRKSVKFGPMRINFSKSGIGTSFGVKGLRVGVNSRGQTYTAGGRHGIYFRENLGSSQKKQNISNMHSSAYDSSSMNENSLKGFGYVCFIVSFLCSFAFPILFIISIPWAIIITINLVNNSKIQKFKKETLSTLDNILARKEYENIDNIISQIPIIIKRDKDKTTFVLEIYKKIAFSFIEDNEINEDEEKILEKIISLVSPNILQEINTVLINEILKTAIEDKKITENEEKLLKKCISLFQLFDQKEEIYRVIEDYKQLEIIENSELNEIKSSININEKNPVYYENSFMLKKIKTVKGIQSIIDDCNGTIVLSSENLHFVTNGHKSIKLSSIISSDLVDKNIELIVNNRKTPIYFYVNNPISFLGILKKLI